MALSSERAYIRKAQYSYGWDWGPSFPTMGIWKPVYLWQPGRGWIESLRFETNRISKTSASGQIHLQLGGNPKNCLAVISLTNESQQIKFRHSLSGEKNITVDFRVNNPDLWWPNGMGKPHLYQLKVELLNSEERVIDNWSSKVGIRTVELVTRDRKKAVFQFVINKKPLFIKGANWIPADSFLNRVGTEKYRHLLQQAADAHMNMLRVWGGGIYEQDDFYRICDELGLLVWQDFMFACGGYPEFPRFVANVREEVTQTDITLTASSISGVVVRK